MKEILIQALRKTPFYYPLRKLKWKLDRAEWEMKEILTQVLRKTPFYYPLRKLRQKLDHAKWERKGRPVPPPYIVKHKLIREYAKRYRLKILVETGTYVGDMVDAMKTDFDRIYSIELSKYLYKKAMMRFRGATNIELIHGDSGKELKKILERINQPALFWLDGHYSGGVTARGVKDTPIYEELDQIFNCNDLGHVIIIDDARLFGRDPAYPSLEELSEFIKSKKSDSEIAVKDDSIRITPEQQ